MKAYVPVFVAALVPVIIIIAGSLMSKKPPKEINYYIGYRTTMSMINKDTWAFAQQYCGKLWMKIGFPMLIVSTIATLPFIKIDNEKMAWLITIIEGIQLVIIFVTIVIVEVALKKTFDRDGKRK